MFLFQFAGFRRLVTHGRYRTDMAKSEIAVYIRELLPIRWGQLFS